jgi:cell fate regulator YaaT (PSP1 superfamily)
MNHLIRVGALGHVGRFRSADGLRYARGQRVVVRTARGLEVGEVLADEPQATSERHGPADADGPLLRRMTDSDEMLAERLIRNRDAAYEACVRVLAERGSDAVLLDVEHLFDGRGLYFYFLGDVDPATEAISAELAAAYDAEARFGQFADTLEQGCGPGCGTAEAKNGCGTAGGCATCTVASACSR